MTNLRVLTLKFFFFFLVIDGRIFTYVIIGSGEPPILLQVNSIGLSSVATATLPGDMTGGCGGVKTVKL